MSDMKNELRRTSNRYDGVFGLFTFDGDSDPFMVTLEHSYQQSEAVVFLAKVPVGTYTCKRGVHQLRNGKPFETFEITGVDGHSGILFHAGNFNKDSEGCVLCGRTVTQQQNGEQMITGSASRFAQFMKRLEGVDEFQLEVK